MKTQILLLLLLVAPALSFAQISTENSLIKPDKGSVRSVMGVVHVLDSSVYSYYSTGSWVYSSKKCIQSRHWGSQGLPNEWITSIYDNNLSQWVNEYYERNTFLNDSIENPDVIFAKSWNSFINNWDDDTLDYFDFTGDTSYQHGPMYENIFISTWYDFNTKSTVGGEKIKINLLNDSLYDNFELLEYNPSTEQWEKSSKTQYTYDANNFLQQETEKSWNPTNNVYENSYQDFFIFTNGLLMQQVSQYWSGSEWINSSKKNYEYDSNNNQSKKTNYDWDAINNIWEPDNQYIYSYTGNNKTEQVYQLWNTGTLVWDNYSRHFYTYNTSGYILTDRSERWISSAWQYNYRTTTTYNSNNLKTLYLRENWDNGGMVWENDYRYTYSYDGNDNQTNYTMQNWDDIASAWEDSEKTDNTYDSFNSKTLEIYSQWDDISSSWEYYNKSEYYWSDFDATNISDILKNPTTVFPNPTSGIINFDSGSNEIQHITISDITGKIVYDASSESLSNKLDLRPYGRGLYNISITTENNETHNSKVVVQ